MSGITVPQEYSYVLLAATSTFFVHWYHMSLTAKYRKASGVKYPNAYASNELAEKDVNAYTFNCAQRAHANYTENLVPVLGSMLVTGLRYPLAAATLGGIWSFSRVIYAYGYTSGAGPSGRSRGAIPSSLAAIALTLAAAYTSVSFFLSN